MVRTFKRLWRDSSGASLIEYSLLIGIMIALIVVVAAVAGIWISGVWVRLLANLSV